MSQRPVNPRPADTTVNSDKRILRFVIFVIVVLLGALVLSVLAGCGSSDPVIVKAAPAVATSSAPHTAKPGKVEIIVTGSPASSTYGAGETISHTDKPFHVSFTTDDSTSYDVNVALKDGGRARCMIKVNGEVVASKRVRGIGGFMSCVVYHDPASNSWRSMYS